MDDPLIMRVNHHTNSKMFSFVLSLLGLRLRKESETILELVFNV